MVRSIYIIRDILLGSVNIAIVLAEFSTYPSIYWNPWNPIFACDDPSINVRIGDTINFLCPSDEYKFYIPPSTDVNMIYENLYFLNDKKEKYEACNATDERRLLRCDDKQATAKYYTISFRDVPTSRHSIEFERGKSYYLIGTGFRSLNQLDNLVNGSCRRSGSEEQFRLRLKINVCEKDDCNICRSEGCYYEKCKSKRSEWVHWSDPVTSNGKCVKLLRRECTYPYLDNTNRTEYKEINLNISKCVKELPSSAPRTEPDVSKAIALNEALNEELQKYKIIVYILLSLLMVMLIAFCSIRCHLSKKVNNCIKRDIETCPANRGNREIVEIVEIVDADTKDGPGEPNLAYNESLLSKRGSKKSKIKKRDEKNPDF